MNVWQTRTMKYAYLYTIYCSYSNIIIVVVI